MTNNLDPDQAQYFIGWDLYQNSAFARIMYGVALNLLPHKVAK